MSKNTCTATNVPSHLECQVCLDAWRDPVQLLKCGHIFCRACVPPSSTRCPQCRGDVTGFQTPGEEIVAATWRVSVVCSSCGWRGTRQASETHRCDSRETHTAYAQYPKRTDIEWVQIATDPKSEGMVRDAEASPEMGTTSETLSGFVLRSSPS